MEEKKEGLIETSKPLRMSSTPPPPPPSVLKPFVDGGLAGLLSCGVNGAIDYSRSISNDARYRNHPNYVLKRKMIPGLVLIDAFAFSQILGYYNIVRGIAVARNDGARPSLYQEAASGLIAGVATAYLRIPFDIICLHRQVKSMGPVAQWSIRKLSVLQILRAGGPLLKRNAGLGMGMVAAYNPSVHYLIETHGFSEQAAKCGLTIYVPFAAVYYSPLLSHVRRSPKFLGFNVLAESCPDGIVIRTLTLRNKAIASNDGMALTLYQEAACGLIAGAAEAYFSFPFVSACLPQVDPTTLAVVQRAKYRNLCDALYSMSANGKLPELWRNAGPYVKTRMGTNVGMLASYNPSLRYLRDSCGLSETRAQLGASAVSAFFGAACSVPVQNVLAHAESGSSLDCALKILKSRGPLAFFSGFSRQFALVGPPIMILWFAYENVRKL
ncbi:hypothetical protein ACLB2K_027541 [Fragaria x ananassa]